MMSLGWVISVTVNIQKGPGLNPDASMYLGNETYTFKVDKLSDLMPLLVATAKMEKQ